MTNPLSGLVAIRMTKGAEGLNVGEVGRFTTAVAERLLKKGHGVLEKVVSDGGVTAVTVQSAIRALSRANDLKRAASKQMNGVRMAINEANEAVALAFDTATRESAEAENGKEILIEQDAERREKELLAETDATGAVEGAQGDLKRHTAALKKAKDKDAAQALIDDSGKAVTVATSALADLKAAHAEEQATREANIEGFVDTGVDVKGTVEAHVAELEAALKAADELEGLGGE